MSKTRHYRSAKDSCQARQRQTASWWCPFCPMRLDKTSLTTCYGVIREPHAVRPLHIIGHDSRTRAVPCRGEKKVCSPIVGLQAPCRILTRCSGFFISQKIPAYGVGFPGIRQKHLLYTACQVGSSDYTGSSNG